MAGGLGLPPGPPRAGRPAPGRDEAGWLGRPPSPARATGRPKAGCSPGCLFRPFPSIVALLCALLLCSLTPVHRQDVSRPAPGRVVCWALFVPNGHIFVATYKKGFFPNFFQDLFPYSLSSIAKYFESLIPPNPSDDSCPNLGKQERRSRSTIPPNNLL